MTIFGAANNRHAARSRPLVEMLTFIFSDGADENRFDMTGRERVCQRRTVPFDFLAGCLRHVAVDGDRRAGAIMTSGLPMICWQ